jgi:hypothetical protein
MRCRDAQCKSNARLAVVVHLRENPGNGNKDRCEWANQSSSSRVEEKRTAFLRGWWSSDVLVRGEETADESGVEGLARLGRGRKRDMRTRRDALLRSEECGVDGAVEVTSVVDDVEPCSTTEGWTPGFFMDERAGGGGRGTGFCAGWGWEVGAGYLGVPRRCGVRDKWRPIAI